MAGTRAGKGRQKPYKGPPMEGMIARWYARVRANDPHLGPAAEEVVAELPDGGRVLEVAPGPGSLAIELAKRGYTVSGLDISRTFIKMARSTAIGAGVSVDFRHGDAANMPFADGSFDLTVCHAAFKNFTDPVGALREMHRVLVPGGVALIGDLRGDATAAEIDAEIRTMGLSRANAAMTRLTFRRFLLKNAYTERDVRRMVASTDFSTCEIGQTNVSLTIRLGR
jgi:ubiquinone/menaquinone biosynthesis C-methylase UbiE